MIKDKIEEVLYDIKDAYRNIKYFFRYRFTDKYHIVDTKLKPGYYDIDMRMLHANFSLLVDYVEVELAHLHTCCVQDEYEKLTWWQKKFGVRSADLGLRYLDFKLDKNDDHYSRSKAKECKLIKDLYHWWTVTRPSRKDAYEKYYELSKRVDMKTLRTDYFLDTQKVEDAEQSSILNELRETLDHCHEIDQQYEKEDEKNLIALIKIRGSLWT